MHNAPWVGVYRPSMRRTHGLRCSPREDTSIVRIHKHSQHLPVAVAGLAAILLASPTPGAAGPMMPGKGAIPSEQPTGPP
jgi:hypothetical protein